MTRTKSDNNRLQSSVSRRFIHYPLKSSLHHRIADSQYFA